MGDIDLWKNTEKIDHESEERLSSLTTIMLIQHYRIIVDSVNIAMNTKNNETRRSRIDLCSYHYRKMMKFRQYCNEEQLEILRHAKVMIQKLH